jgi:hypothetical protein
MSAVWTVQNEQSYCLVCRGLREVSHYLPLKKVAVLSPCKHERGLSA